MSEGNSSSGPVIARALLLAGAGGRRICHRQPHVFRLPQLFHELVQIAASPKQRIRALSSRSRGNFSRGIGELVREGRKFQLAKQLVGCLAIRRPRCQLLEIELYLNVRFDLGQLARLPNQLGVVAQ